MGTSFVMVISLAATLSLALSTPQQAALRRFDQAVEGYVTLHRQIEREVAPQMMAEAGGLLDAVDRMAVAIVAARPAARRGDLFDAEVSAVLRTRLQEALRLHGHRVADALATMEHGDEPLPALVVNGRFPPGLWSMTLPCLLEALPRLPEELQYRFAGRDLLLIDVHANIIVDILPGALKGR